MINGEVVQIVEIQARSVQGRTLPFRCRGADGRLYYVKGRDAGRQSLIAEWLASSLALAFGLPVAEFRIVEIPEEMEWLGLPDFQDLGVGYAFGSVIADSVIDLPFGFVDRVPDQLRRDVAVFDWWVKNDDRTLTSLGGNVNLLWHVVQQELIVIDYNLAFDDTFDPRQFLAGHVFAADWNSVYQDFIARPAYETRMRTALRRFEEACDKMPDDWLEVAPGVPARLTPDKVKHVLDRVDLADFWNKT
ncbi:HipA family kinase [Paraburkholderia sp. SIMBA_009]|uniref:HipA-like kinase domain-containing protein n=1 Tax=Paraburkholderia tropica TaxID=92647 RepID=A0AAQ1GP89_9BURK|nr:HipA family kinase [Paraburkholderia tropica]QNB17350.1 HipA domain-containing protein [Paraburkholderia tropica]RQN34167.1 hypothetical protein EHZ25_35875 [Paraburkholderia tropica]SEK15199.1 hypothetical protein SAMN05216550_13512 [Paraburkholderia tropica]